jgi:DNA-binding Lrp family transcriptional regulator
MSVFKWAEAIEGELTKKQEQALATMKTIVNACSEKPMSVKQLKQATKLSASALSKHLRELIRQGVIKGKVVLNEANRMEDVFTHNPSAALKMKGKKPQSVEETFRIYVPKDRKQRRFIQHGYTRTVRGVQDKLQRKKSKRKRFVPDSEPLEM